VRRQITKAVTTSSFIKDNMLIDPSMQTDIIRRAVDGNFGDNPSQAVQSLGTVKTPDGREVGVHLRHAADAVLLDDLGQVVLVTRKHNPGAGLKALPGGFMDPVQGRGGATVAENALTGPAAARGSERDEIVDPSRSVRPRREILISVFTWPTSAFGLAQAKLLILC